MQELNVKVGDKVLLMNGYSYNLTKRISEVTKITPTGRIRIKGSDAQFDKFGHKMGGGDWSAPCQIKPMTDEEILEFNERQKQIAVINKAFKICKDVTRDDLSYEKALKIIEILEEN